MAKKELPTLIRQKFSLLISKPGNQISFKKKGYYIEKSHKLEIIINFKLIIMID